MNSEFQMDFWPQLEGSLEGSRTNTDASLQGLTVRRKRVKKTTKGQRVHKCEHPDCNKVFTMAEHRRRHELTHTSTTIYPCDYEGCTMKYKRAASLMRHQHQQHLPPEKNNLPLAINEETLCLPSINRLDGFSAQPPHTPSMLTQEVEDISEPGFGFENSLGDLFQEPGYTENGRDVGGPAPDVLAQTTQLHEPDNIEYLAPSIQPPPVGLEATIYQCLHKVLRPDAFKAAKAAFIPPDMEQVLENNSLP